MEFIKWLGTTGNLMKIACFSFLHLYLYKSFFFFKFLLQCVSEISKAKVIDMTGREQRILSGYSALSAKKVVDSSDSELPGINKDKFELEKLSYNLENLVNLCEQVIGYQ